jgi:hypothetical protein
MLTRFAQALDVNADDILGLKPEKPNGTGQKSSLRLLRRLNRIEDLPPSQQKTLIKTIDTFLRAAGK